MHKHCLYCYKELKGEEVDYHSACLKKIFGVPQVPELPYTHDDLSNLAKEVIRAHITIPGVQSKLSLHLEKTSAITARFTIVGVKGKYILKPQADAYEQLPEIEDLTMHLAELAGIKTVPHTLVRFADGRLCYLTKRIDRNITGKKIAMEDMCQLSERLTEYKYNGSYEQIAKLILRHASMIDVIRFWEQVLFYYLTGNADMHLKNFSLYRPDKQHGYRLSPAYDMLATALVMPEDTEELALTLNGKKRNIKKKDFIKAFANSGLNERVINNIFARFQSTLPKWNDFIGISFLSREMKLRYKDLIRDAEFKIFGEP